MKIEDIKAGMKVKIRNVEKYVADGSRTSWYTTTGVSLHDKVRVSNCVDAFWVLVSDLTPYEEQYTCNIPGVTVDLIPGKEYCVSDYSVREAVCDPVRGKYICTIKGRHYMEMDEHSVCGWRYAVDPDIYKEPETEMTVEEIAEALRKSGAIKGKLKIKE